MADFLVQATLSNLLVATILAVIACRVQARVRSASLGNLVWASVLTKKQLLIHTDMQTLCSLWQSCWPRRQSARQSWQVRLTVAEIWRRG